MFKCDCCGCCCRNIRLSSLYDTFNRGDGICKFFDERTSLCSIYANRPLLCNVDAAYEKYFSKTMSREEYYEMNYKSCQALKALSVNRGVNKEIRSD